VALDHESLVAVEDSAVVVPARAQRQEVLRHHAERGTKQRQRAGGRGRRQRDAGEANRRRK
jgi:hypothetical protein